MFEIEERVGFVFLKYRGMRGVYAPSYKQFRWTLKAICSSRTKVLVNEVANLLGCEVITDTELGLIHVRSDVHKILVLLDKTNLLKLLFVRYRDLRIVAKEGLRKCGR